MIQGVLFVLVVQLIDDVEQVGVLVVKVLHADVVLRADLGAPSGVRGALALGKVDGQLFHLRLQGGLLG